MSGAFGLALIAGVLLGGIAWAMHLDARTDGYLPEALVIGLGIAGIWTLQNAAQTLPAGAAMAVAASVAAVVAVVLSVAVFREGLSGPQLGAAGVMALGALGFVAASMR
jgi:multidrug transporter EmrE-like cation transporter